MLSPAVPLDVQTILRPHRLVGGHILAPGNDAADVGKGVGDVEPEGPVELEQEVVAPLDTGLAARGAGGTARRCRRGSTDRRGRAESVRSRPGRTRRSSVASHRSCHDQRETDRLLVGRDLLDELMGAEEEAVVAREQQDRVVGAARVECFADGCDHVVNREQRSGHPAHVPQLTVDLGCREGRNAVAEPGRLVGIVGLVEVGPGRQLQLREGIRQVSRCWLDRVVRRDGARNSRNG